MSKPKLSPQTKYKIKDEPNKRLIIWVSSAIGVIIAGMAVLLIINN